MSNSLLLNKTSRYLFTAWWLLWSAIQWNILNRFSINNIVAATDSLLSNILLGLSCLLIINNMRYYLPKKEKYWYVIAVSLIISFVWVVLTKFILNISFKNNNAYNDFLLQSLSLRFAFGFLMTGCISTISLLWYTQQEMVYDETQKKEIEQLAKDAELFKLRQQLQPHFLFNSLNSISALVVVQPEKARHMIQQLSDFLRGTLKKEEKQRNSLQEELQYLQLYLDIEKVRFGHRLNTVIDAAENIQTALIPSLLLQPVVENAIKFGLYDTVDAVTISISAKLTKGVLTINISNPYDESTASSTKGTGFGLASVQRRLFLIFGRTDLLSTSTDNNIFTATLLIPQIDESNNN